MIRSLSLESRVQNFPLMKEGLLILGVSMFIGLFGHISLPLPFTPVPLATQAQVILFLAAFLGSRRATLATAGFLAQGICGLPVFAGGASGFLCFAGPTGGYLLGYLIAAFVTGYMVENQQKRTVEKTFLALAVGNAVIFVTGALWLSSFIGAKASFILGVLPFIIGDFIKLTLAIKGLKALRFFS